MKYLNTTVALSIFLTGCGSFQPKSYVEPIAGQTAVLTIANKSNDRLKVWYMANAENCTETSYVNGGSGLDAQTTLRLSYPAGKKIAFYFIGVREGQFKKERCSFILSTALTPGDQYLAIYSADENTCKLAEAKVESNGTFTKQKFMVEREYAGGGELFGWCRSEK
jgi:hypothetical protein